MCLLIPVPFMIFTTAMASKVSDIVPGSTEPADKLAILVGGKIESNLSPNPPNRLPHHIHNIIGRDYSKLNIGKLLTDCRFRTLM